ncbi:hypothetical protein [Methylobacterium nigriterrae]|uniref:hypothetical protein n=1 Tax=Methylobacterium nigriterrae TaxID=3127512 RepID=UPI003013E0AF
MGKLVLLLAETRYPRNAQGRVLLMEALSDLKAEALAADRSADTLAAIRATKMMVQIPDRLSARPLSGR